MSSQSSPEGHKGHPPLSHSDPEQQRLLVLDAGNTRIKWGIREAAQWSRRGAIATADASGLWDEVGAVRVDAIVASNVAGPAVQASLEGLAARLGRRLRTIASVPEQLGVKNGYRDPAQLGTDRWAALIGAHHAAPGDKIVANAGTALTIDALRADGQFLGGLIIPGPAMMRRALDRGTAGLRLTEGEFRPFPRSTPDAITSGALQAASGAVMRLAHAMATDGCLPQAVLLSGGAADEIAPHLPIAPTILENLVLDGLVLIARGS
jgi:type III pantothenate kinase